MTIVDVIEIGEAWICCLVESSNSDGCARRTRHRIYGDASGGSLCQARWCLSQSAGDGIGDEEDCAVAADVVG